MTISRDDIEAIARRVIELQREAAAPVSPAAVADSDPWLTRRQAAAYLNLPTRTFDRKREENPEALKPCSEHPLRWSRNALDVFKLTRGVPLYRRRGRKRQEAVAA